MQSIARKPSLRNGVTNPARMPRYFAVTTSGLTATRWLSHVLASHPDVYVAHGKFALDSIQPDGFASEKETANRASLTCGNQTRTFYESRPLEEVLALYRGIRLHASVYGCVHSYTVHALAQAAMKPETLDAMNVHSVVRHPINFVASHMALLRSAERHPPLYRFYHDEVFPAVLGQYPELFLLPCPDYRAFIACALSCHAVNNFLFEMCYPGVPIAKMEVLTTEADALAELCLRLTGLDYSQEKLNEFIAHGAINQHRPGKPKSVAETFNTWESWQKDMAHMMISPLVLDWFEGLGYDLSLLRQNERKGSAEAKSPCLADCLRSLDNRHPFLAYLTAKGSNRCQAIEAEYHGFRLIHEGNAFIAVANVVSDRLPSNLAELEEDGLCVRGETLGSLWHQLAKIVSQNPRWVEEYRRYNLIHFRDSVYAAKTGMPINLELLRAPQRRSLIEKKKLFVAKTLDDAKRQVDPACRDAAS